MTAKIKTCSDCGKALMEHAAYSNAFIEVLFHTDNPVEDIALSEKARKQIQKIIAVDELRTKDETESRMNDLIDCD